MWTKEKLYVARQKTVHVCGDDFTIRKINVTEFNGEEEEKDDKRRNAKMMAQATVDPVLTTEEVAKLDLDIYLGLQKEIMDFNGIGKKAKEAVQGN